MKPTIIVLAAGLGTRMKSNLAKALHPLVGRPLIQHVLKAATSLGPEKLIVVLGHQAEQVMAAVQPYGAEIVIQKEQLGTGHAVLQARELIAGSSGPIIVLCGDAPLIMPETLNALVDVHTKSRAAVTVTTTLMENPFGYGRVVRNRSKTVTAIVEERDATTAQKKIREVNAGTYCFDTSFLLSSLSALGTNNAQREYYLPDTIAIAGKKHLSVNALLCANPDEVMGVNTRIDLSRAEQVLRARINARWMTEGVTLMEPESTIIEDSVVLERDVTLYPNVIVSGKTRIGEGSVVLPGTRIIDSTIGRSVTVKDCSVIEQSSVSDNASIGPFAHLRPGSIIGSRARIGNFVEIKKSNIGEGSKANHLSYIGDATVGRDVNIGAGVITCNYDGFEKHETIIEDEVFVGSDSQLVAPVTIGKGALIGAGTTVTQNVPPDALAISRVPQTTREEFVKRRKQVKGKQ